jgi:Mg-chelatase subunit ChlD
MSTRSKRKEVLVLSLILSSVIVDPARAACRTNGHIGSGAATKIGSVAAGAAKPSSSAAPKIGSVAAGSTAAKLGSQAATAVPAPQAGSVTTKIGSVAAGSVAATPSATSAAAAPAVSASKYPLHSRRIEDSLPKPSSKKPGMLAVFVDGSDSMTGTFAGQAGISKADAVADVINGVLRQFQEFSTQSGEVRPRFDVMLEAYGSYTGSLFAHGPLAGKEIASITEIAHNPTEVIDVLDAEGQSVPTPIWVRPFAGGNTPMYRAFENGTDRLTRWSRRPQESHLVLGINVTDGAYTTADPTPNLVRFANEVESKGGKLLMTNIHISKSGDGTDALVFPTPAEIEKRAAELTAAGKGSDARNLEFLFGASSEIPVELCEKLGFDPTEGRRMTAYNATIDQLGQVFEAGSSVAAGAVQ